MKKLSMFIPFVLFCLTGIYGEPSAPWAFSETGKMDPNSIKAIALYCAPGIAAEASRSWLISKTGKFDCKRINVGFSKVQLVLASGEKITLPIDQVDSYSVDGKVFNKLLLYKNGSPTRKMVFMELVKTSGELALYKYSHPETEGITPDQISYSYFVYSGNQLHLAINEKTLPSVCNYFGLQYAQK